MSKGTKRLLEPSHLQNMQAITENMMFNLADFMASATEKRPESQRPHPLHISKSFSRVEPSSPDILTRSQRSSTVPNGVNTGGVMADKPTTILENGQLDAFEKSPEEYQSNGVLQEPSGKLPDDFDQLPIELVSLSDR